MLLRLSFYFGMPAILLSFSIKQRMNANVFALSHIALLMRTPDNLDLKILQYWILGIFILADCKDMQKLNMSILILQSSF